MENKQPLLSICIPTYNRANLLDQSLARIIKEFNGLENKADVEIFVSDNQSPDNTPEIVEKYISNGLPIQYIRNTTNIGGDRNIIQCFRLAKGKYALVLGDDDFPIEGSLHKILNVLEQGDYGVVNLQMYPDKSAPFTLYENPQEFVVAVGYWFTFISGNIVNSKYISKIDLDKFIETSLLQVPLYMEAVFSEKRNVIVHERLLDFGIVATTNVGYNFFEVFVTNFLGIFKETMRQGFLSRMSYEKIKYILYKNFICIYVYRFLKKRNMGSQKLNEALKILIKNYGLYPYTYIIPFVYIIEKIFKVLAHPFRKRIPS